MTGVRASVDVELEPKAAFDAFIGELSSVLSRKGLRLHPGPSGRMTMGGSEIGRVVVWRPPLRIAFEWRSADWEPSVVGKLDFRFTRIRGGTRVTVESADWGRLLGDRGDELAGWFASEMVVPLLEALAPPRFGDWFTDRRARRPSGPQARDTYRDPLYHRPNFLAILEALSLSRSDYLVEVGCGGGAFLEQALRSGCRAAAIDHSLEMIQTAREKNQRSVEDDRLEIVQADACSLPFREARFSCAVMTGVFGFLTKPDVALAEIRRVLGRDGRLVLTASSAALRGTPAAPEPMASRLRFYEDEELVQLAEAAGFDEARVDRPDLRAFAEQSGVPKEDLDWFSGRMGQLLLATKR
jgi:SAM-dependent methyltransferase